MQDYKQNKIFRDHTRAYQELGKRFIIIAVVFEFTSASFENPSYKIDNYVVFWIF